MFLLPRPGSDAGGHYTNEGNAWVAERIYRFLDTLPAVAPRLSSTSPSGESTSAHDVGLPLVETP